MMAALSVEPQSRKKIIGLVLLLSFSTIVAFLVTNKVSAHNNFSPDFVWDYPNIQIYVEGRQSFPYTTQLCQGAADIDSNTVISIPNCGYSNTGYTDEYPGDINHFYENYGSQWEFFAGSDPWWWVALEKNPALI